MIEEHFGHRLLFKEGQDLDNLLLFNKDWPILLWDEEQELLCFDLPNILGKNKALLNEIGDTLVQKISSEPLHVEDTGLGTLNDPLALPNFAYFSKKRKEEEEEENEKEESEFEQGEVEDRSPKEKVRKKMSQLSLQAVREELCALPFKGGNDPFLFTSDLEKVTKEKPHLQHFFKENVEQGQTTMVLKEAVHKIVFPELEYRNSHDSETLQKLLQTVAPSRRKKQNSSKQATASPSKKGGKKEKPAKQKEIPNTAPKKRRDPNRGGRKVKLSTLSFKTVLTVFSKQTNEQQLFEIVKNLKLDEMFPWNEDSYKKALSSFFKPQGGKKPSSSRENMFRNALDSGTLSEKEVLSLFGKERDKFFVIVDKQK